MIAIPDGTTIADAYRIDARLGSGAFGTVYRVEHRFLGRMALKLLSYESDHQLRRAAAEGAAHARLTHPNVTRVFDVNTCDVSGELFLYIASEYMPMGDLDRYLDDVQRMSLVEARRLAGHLLAALEYAHGQDPPLLHRDLKPANVLLGGHEDLTFKLADFGVSAELSAASGVVAAAGTIVFQAPECSFGPYLVESDIYGAAVVLYRALTGVYPFPLGADALDAGALEHAKQNPPPPSRFFLGCNAATDQVMLQALAPNPFNRYHTAADFKCAILAALG
jgi:serine/threonine-protein kinase